MTYLRIAGIVICAIGMITSAAAKNRSACSFAFMAMMLWIALLLGGLE